MILRQVVNCLGININEILSIYHEVNPRWIIELNVQKIQTIKLEEKINKYL